MLQYVNIGIIILLVNMDLIKGEGLFLGFIPIFNG